MGFSTTMPSFAASRRKNEASKGALCATKGRSSAKVKNRGSTWEISGCPLTISFVIPVSSVIKYGIGSPGSTRASKRSMTSPNWTFTAPISVIMAFPIPVVSKSKATKPG